MGETKNTIKSDVLFVVERLSSLANPSRTTLTQMFSPEKLSFKGLSLFHYESSLSFSEVFCAPNKGLPPTLNYHAGLLFLFVSFKFYFI